MMKRVYTVFFTAFICVFAAFAQNEDVVRAEQLYENQQYDSALVVYENLLKQGYHNAVLYYNIGNVYYKKNDLARAILYYEKAFLLNPHDSDIQHNLDFARAQQADKIESLGSGFVKSWYERFYRLFNPNEWIVLSIISFLLFLSGLALFFFSSQLVYRKSGFFIGLFLLLVSLVSYISAQSRYTELTAHEFAIVVEPTVSIKTEPLENSKDLTVIHGGLKVEIIQEKKDWILILLSDGNKGWIEKRFIEEI
ncbi:MAG: tetratricopeptide repeat protein [Bacteroidota bacterium]